MLAWSAACGNVHVRQLQAHVVSRCKSVAWVWGGIGHLPPCSRSPCSQWLRVPPGRNSQSSQQLSGGAKQAPTKAVRLLLNILPYMLMLTGILHTRIHAPATFMMDSIIQFVRHKDSCVRMALIAAACTFHFMGALSDECHTIELHDIGMPQGS